ncbi:MAG: CoA-transferase [Nitrososphaerales archaeon]
MHHISDAKQHGGRDSGAPTPAGSTAVGWSDEEIAARIARDIPDGWTVNLGVGLPTLVAPLLSSRRVLVHSENGILGVGGPVAVGHEDPDLVHAWKGWSTLVPGAAIMDSVVSFTLIRGGRLDLSIMGAYQVSMEGDLANWRIGGSRLAGIGGAADLAYGARRLWVAMRFRAKDGSVRLVRSCTYPLTARACTSRVYTDVGVFLRRSGRLLLVEPASPTAAAEVQSLLRWGSDVAEH